MFKTSIALYPNRLLSRRLKGHQNTHHVSIYSLIRVKNLSPCRTKDLPHITASLQNTRDPLVQFSQMETRLWTFEDMKDAMKRQEKYRNTDNPVRHYFYGVALEMAGQPEEADRKYIAFRYEVERVFGNLESGASQYEAEVDAFVGDTRRIEHYIRMVDILRRPVPGDDDFRSGTCLVG